MRQRRESEATDAVVCLLAKKPLHTGVRTGCHYLITLSVCVSVCMCNIRRFYWSRELYEADFHKLGIYGSGRVWANAWGVFHRAPSRGGRGHRVAVDFAVCFGWGEIFPNFFFFERTRLAAIMRPPCLIYFYAKYEATPRERSDRAVVCLLAKSLFIPGCVQGAII